MKILYIASSSRWGGGSAALYNLISGLKKYGHDSYVLFPNEQDKRFCVELDKIGINYTFADYHLTIYPHTKNPLKFIVRLFRVIKKQLHAQRIITSIIQMYNPDIVHTNVGPLDIALTPCQKCHIPHVWHLREYQDKDFGMTSYPSKSYFIKRISQKGNYNIAITNGVFSYWKLNPQKDVIIYDGVFSKNVEEIRCSIDKIILFAGRVERAKGLYDVLIPFSKLIKMHPDFKLIVAGRYSNESSYYQQCIRLIDKLGITDSISFLGEISNVNEWMAKSKALIVASQFEGFGFITAEAMLNLCFVIGRNTAGTKDQFDKCLEATGIDCGYRFMDEDSLLEGLTYAVEHDTSEQCKLAYSVVINNYTIERHCASVEAYYQKILSSN